MWARALRLVGIVLVSMFCGYLIGDFMHSEAVAPPPAPAPGAFVVANLSIEPAEVQPNETVTITVSVANTHDTWGLYSLVLEIDGVREAERQVMVAGGTRDFSFSVTREEPGTYFVFINGLSGSFTVVAPAPEEEVRRKEEAGCSGNQGRGFNHPRFLLPVPCGALTVIGVSTLPP